MAQAHHPSMFLEAQTLTPTRTQWSIKSVPRRPLSPHLQPIIRHHFSISMNNQCIIHISLLCRRGALRCILTAMLNSWTPHVMSNGCIFSERCREPRWYREGDIDHSSDSVSSNWKFCDRKLPSALWSQELLKESWETSGGEIISTTEWAEVKYWLGDDRFSRSRSWDGPCPLEKDKSWCEVAFLAWRWATGGEAWAEWTTRERTRTRCVGEDDGWFSMVLRRLTAATPFTKVSWRGTGMLLIGGHGLRGVSFASLYLVITAFVIFGDPAVSGGLGINRDALSGERSACGCLCTEE